MKVNFFFSLFICLGLFLSSCSPSDPLKKATSCDVLVSIPPYLYFVEELTEGELKAVSLVPEGANPHLYEPTPKQVEEAKTAKVWVCLSEHFERRVTQSLQEHNPHLIMVDLADKLPLIGHKSSCKCGHAHKDDFDPHFWLSLRLAQTQIDLIAKALIKGFPERTDQIQSRLAIVKEKFTQADSLLSEQLAPYAGEIILVSHPAFAYFCQDYKLQQLSIEQEGKDPLPQELASILQTVHSQKIRAILTQAQYNNKGAELIAEKLDTKTIEVDPYSPDYLNNLFYIAHCIQHHSS